MKAYNNLLWGAFCLAVVALIGYTVGIISAVIVVISLVIASVITIVCLQRDGIWRYGRRRRIR